MSEDTPLMEYLLENQGDALIFSIGGSIVATSKHALRKSIEEGDDIIYECRDKFVYNPPSSFGTFEYRDIYKTPYCLLRLTGNYVVPLEEARKFLETQIQFVKLEKTEKKLKYIASRSSVLAGGPLVGANHCQEETNTVIYSALPFKPVIDAGMKNDTTTFANNTENTNTKTPNNEDISVRVRIGEELLTIPIGDATAKHIREEVARLRGVEAGRVTLIFAGRRLGDDDKVAKDSVIQGMIRSEGGAGKKKKGTRKKRWGRKRTLEKNDIASASMSRRHKKNGSS